ncbi:MAG TPA: hypothetical protein VHL31_03305, partial [Geminicoccus sp.]|uniref:hypothetical protein n=1 Tax=Geminicoccus sp. TaxID=2024832 RepID=UPI002E2F1D39
MAGALLATSSLVPSHVMAADPPKLERVVMATSGMGWLSFAATPDADGHVALDLPAGQLDDALKSLTVLARGPSDLRLRQVTIGGRGVLADPFQDIPLRATDMSGLGRLLDRLRGASVVVEGDPPVEGRIIAVENREEGDDGVAVNRPSLVLSTEDGLVAISLDEERTVRLDDPQAQR